MAEEAQFRDTYSTLAKILQFDSVDSPEYCNLLREWKQAGSPRDIKTFLFRQAKTVPELPQIID
ncbi:MAG TPA: hypothetical protein VM165_05550 [Planctomycetaceae bacterium]|nr:hypothetical protein [Planctomycetaceae bacterium]